MDAEISADERRVRELVESLFEGADVSDAVAFLGKQFDLGLARVHYPVGEGGIGIAPRLQAVVQEAIAAQNGPSHPFNVGPGMVGPTLVTHGTEEMKARFLRRLYSSEDCWCQLFSEPDAGSDLAALSTRAVKDGDEWVFNGQKVWTSLANRAQWGLLLARTDPDAPKHRGLTAFIVDMGAPGLSVNPLRQMNGTAEFNEVFFSDVRTPDSLRVGAIGDGWRVALTTLMNERVHIGGSQPRRGEGVIAPAIDAWSMRPGTAVSRDQLLQLFVEAEVHRLSNIRAAQMRSSGTPGPEGSIGKLFAAELGQKVLASTMNLLGPEATLYPGYSAIGWRDSDPRARFLGSPSLTIAGGTSEIMRNMIAERTLGLPPDIRVDPDVAWKDLPRSAGAVERRDS